MTEKANKRHSGLGKFFDRIFRGRSNSLPSSSSSSVDAVRKGDAAKKKKNKKDNKTAAPSENDFGVVETERLTHFQKPKPPANRRRPRGVPASTSSLRVATIREEDEASDERCQPPEVEEKNMNVVIVEDKVTEVPRLFTPALPPPGVNFTKALNASFSHADPKSAKCFFAFLGSLLVKAACKMLVKSFDPRSARQITFAKRSTIFGRRRRYKFDKSTKRKS